MSLDNQFMSNRETSPTGFDQAFKWKGGFDQLNWLISRESVVYARYDWIRGDNFDDRGAGGVTYSHPSETDVVVGYQHLIKQNVKFIGEYRKHAFEDTSTTPVGRLTDNGFTLRVMIGL
ncbi:MAG TPA: hypothetical protein VIW78_12870 [Burkholderiales bacterium]